ncbi:MAG: oligosaccharide flippase family protein, partial [Planctomycetota bacterium]|nr:oligosaccharide flippase family protein [Planctomycetota bacterium]
MTQAAVIPEQPVESIETTGAAAEEMAAPRGRLTRRVIHASMWTIGGYAGAQALRLISNLILTRLLLPEHFGLMLIVMVFLQGLQMFSDIGLSPAVVKSDHGDDPVFLNTAWTMQVIRGALLWAAATALAWPAALIYGEEQLTELLALVAL